MSKNEQRHAIGETSRTTLSGMRDNTAERSNSPSHVARYIKDPRSGAAVRQYVRTQWPRIGGESFQFTDPETFLDPAFVGLYRPGMRAFVYVAGSGENAADGAPTGTLGLGRRFWMPWYRIGATRLTDLRARMMELNLDRYAALVRVGGRLVEEPGFDNWALQQLHPTMKPVPNSPVLATPRALQVTLPQGISLQVFEKSLHLRMLNASLAHWVSTPEGAAHCREIGIDPAIGRRMTRVSFGISDRISRSQEIYCFRPRSADADRLVAICESIVLGFVRGGLPSSATLERWQSRNQGYRSPG